MKEAGAITKDLAADIPKLREYIDRRICEELTKKWEEFKVSPEGQADYADFAVEATERLMESGLTLLGDMSTLYEAWYAGGWLGAPRAYKIQTAAGDIFTLHDKWEFDLLFGDGGPPIVGIIGASPLL
jgi:hypothetical protein